MTKDLVDDVCERWRRSDHDAGPGDVFLGPVRSHDELAFRWLRGGAMGIGINRGRSP